MVVLTMGHHMPIIRELYTALKEAERQGDPSLKKRRRGREKGLCIVTYKAAV